MQASCHIHKFIDNLLHVYVLKSNQSYRQHRNLANTTPRSSSYKKNQQVLHAQLTPQIIPRICQENNLSSHSRHDILIRTKYYHFAIKYREQFMLLAQAMANKWFNSSRTTVVYMVLHKEGSVVIKFSREL